jgi:ferredoxin--NADP+ reductase
LRVAVIGSGPAGFYTVQHLFQADDVATQIDMFDRLPTPFGLVRHGVAPDHPKIKNVTAVYHKLACRPGFRFFGNVEYGRDLKLADLRELYDQVVFCTGAQSDRRLGIPGEDLRGSHPATEFVAWYNGHPDYADLEFDLDCETAVVVGVGNVAVDVARILCRTIDELERTDMADHALEALRRSRVEQVYLVGRRGPVQAAFTNPEVKELGELEGASVETLADEMELDPLSRAALEKAADRSTRRKLDILRSYVGSGHDDRPRRLVLRFLVSPVELIGDDAGRVSAVRLVRNELFAREDGKLMSRPTDREETIEAGLVFRSVGYRGVPLPDLPFRDDWAIIPNQQGRVIDPESERPIPGLYVSGWIKRGPSGVIGTNKPDALETVGVMLEDLRDGRLEPAIEPEEEAVIRRLTERDVRHVSYDDWKRIDALEIAAGKARGRPRVKLIRPEEFQKALEA